MFLFLFFFFFKQKTAYEIGTGDWSSDVCSSDLGWPFVGDMMTQDPLLVDRTLEGGGPYQVADDDLEDRKSVV